jgi:hypothetical protein
LGELARYASLPRTYHPVRHISVYLWLDPPLILSVAIGG